MWPILIKADDLFVDADLGKWSKFIRTVDKNKARVDIGFISKPPENETAFEKYTKWLNGVNTGVISFFDHGSTHTLEEYTSDSNEYYNRQFSITREFQKRVFGRELNGFGAPYNSMSLSFLEYFGKLCRDSYIYYPDIVAGANPIGLDFVSHQFHVSFELKSENYDPSAKYFRVKYAKSLAEKRPLVLQVHPNRWSEAGFEQFSEILTYLRRLGADFLTPRAFIEQTRHETAQEPPIALKANVGGWFLDRYTDASLAQTKSLLDKVLALMDKNLDTTGRGADFGAGVGDWLYVLSSMNPGSKFYAVEPSKDLAEFARAKFADSGKGNVEVLNVDFRSANLSEIDMTFCNRALNYFDLATYAKKLVNISSESSCHFVGYQNIAFYLRGLLSALHSGNLDLAKRRVNVLTSSLEYLAGTPERRTSETCVPTRVLVQLFEYYGFDLVGESHQDGVFSGNVGIVTGLVFSLRDKKNSRPECSIDHVGLIKEIEQAGEGIITDPSFLREVEPIAGRVNALRKGQFDSLVDWFQKDVPIEKQKIPYIGSVIALFGSGRHEACMKLLSLCDFNDF